MKVTKETLIVDILKSVKGSKDLFEKHNMACFSCMGVQNESLEKGCLMHGIDVNKILKEIENINK